MGALFALPCLVLPLIMARDAFTIQYYVHHVMAATTSVYVLYRSVYPHPIIEAHQKHKLHQPSDLPLLPPSRLLSSPVIPTFGDGVRRDGTLRPLL